MADEVEPGVVEGAQKMFALYNEKYFSSKLDAGITVVFRQEPHPRGRLIPDPLGEWHPDTKTIRIHPRLSFSKTLSCGSLLHEMVHASVGDTQHGPIYMAEYCRIRDAGAFDFTLGVSRTP